MTLRGRRRDRSGLSARSGMYLLTGRRSHISTLTARRPLPAAKLNTDHPQLNGGAEQPSPGEDSGVLLTSTGRPEGYRMYATPVYKRALYLTSDAIVLTLAAPFLAVWWIMREIKRRRS